MPYGVRKRGKRFQIVNKRTGEVKGTSSTRAKAQASANARNAAGHGWKPSRGKR